MATGETGIIPAGAGRSFRPFQSRTDGRYHPRGCGEKMLSEEVRNGGRGSSPRVRGKGCLKDKRERLTGIIPAGAGKRQRLAILGRGGGDHPRGCGEKDVVDFILVVELGSSPRVRGKGNRVVAHEVAAGIIPAGAGKRVFAWRSV